MSSTSEALALDNVDVLEDSGLQVAIENMERKFQQMTEEIDMLISSESLNLHTIASKLETGAFGQAAELENTFLAYALYQDNEIAIILEKIDYLEDALLSTKVNIEHTFLNDYDLFSKINEDDFLYITSKLVELDVSTTKECIKFDNSVIFDVDAVDSLCVNVVDVFSKKLNDEEKQLEKNILTSRTKMFKATTYLKTFKENFYHNSRYLSKLENRVTELENLLEKLLEQSEPSPPSIEDRLLKLEGILILDQMVNSTEEIMESQHKLTKPDAMYSRSSKQVRTKKKKTKKKKGKDDGSKKVKKKGKRKNLKDK